MPGYRRRRRSARSAGSRRRGRKHGRRRRLRIGAIMRTEDRGADAAAIGVNKWQLSREVCGAILGANNEAGERQEVA